MGCVLDEEQDTSLCHSIKQEQVLLSVDQDILSTTHNHDQKSHQSFAFHTESNSGIWEKDRYCVRLPQVHMCIGRNCLLREDIGTSSSTFEYV